MGNAKPVRERSKKMWLSVGGTAGGIVVAVVLTVFIILAVSRAEKVESSGGTATPDAVDTDAVAGRSVVLSPTANDESAVPEPPAGGVSTESDIEVRQLGGADSVSVFLGSVVADEPAGADAVEPVSQLTATSLRALYPAAATGTRREHGSVLTAVVERLASNTDGDGPGEPENLPVSPLRRDYVNRSVQELTAEVGAVDRVYLVLDGSSGAHVLLRNRERNWWSMWLSVSAGEIVDIEYRRLSDGTITDAP